MHCSAPREPSEPDWSPGPPLPPALHGAIRRHTRRLSGHRVEPKYSSPLWHALDGWAAFVLSSKRENVETPTFKHALMQVNKSRLSSFHRKSDHSVIKAGNFCPFLRKMNAMPVFFFEDIPEEHKVTDGFHIVWYTCGAFLSILLS